MQISTMETPPPPPVPLNQDLKTGSDRAGWITLGILFLTTPLLLKLPLQVNPWAYFAILFGAIGLVAAATGNPKSVVNIALVGIVAGLTCLLWMLILAVANDSRSQTNEAAIRVFCIGLPCAIATIYACASIKPWWLRYAVPGATYVLAMPLGALAHPG